MTVPQNRSNEDLVECISNGDQKAFQELFDRLMIHVFRLSFSILLDRQAAEDVTQETFIRLWKQAEEWRPDATIKTWLFTVARNLSFDVLRKRKNDERKHEELYKYHLVSASSPDLKAEAFLDREKHGKIIQNAVFLLPERQREAVTLVYYMEVQNTEAAEIMGMGAAAFDSLLARARRNLRDKMHDEEAELKGFFVHGAE